MTSFIFYDDKMVRLVKPREESTRLTAERGTFSGYLRRYLQDKLASSVRKGAYLVILVGGHGNKIRFRENVSPEGAVREFENVVGSHNVKAWLIFVHRVKNGLQKTSEKTPSLIVAAILQIQI